METAKQVAEDARDAASSFVRHHPVLAGAGLAVLISMPITAYLERRVRNNTILELDLAATSVVHNEVAPLSGVFGPSNAVSIKWLLTALHAASKDARVRGIVVRLGNRIIPLATAQELRGAVQALRAAGKLTVAYADNFGGMGVGALIAYYLASAFGEVYLAQSGDVALTDLNLERPFVRSALYKLGLRAHVFARKEYKSFPNMFVEDKMPDPERESMRALLESLRQTIVTEVAAARGVDEKTAAEWLAAGPFPAREALERKMVDGLAYRDEVYDKVAAAVGVKRDDLSLLFLSRYAKKNKPSFSSCGSAKVAYLNLSGAIHEGESESDLAGNVTSIGSDTVCRCLRGIAQEPSFKAVLIHISSGGGAYTASDQIAHAVRLVKAAGKKVVVAMHGVAASGGYFVAQYADRIVALPTTVTGSIGVFFGKFITQEMWAKLGVTWDGVAFSENSKFFDGNHDYTEEGRRRGNVYVDRVYEDFVRQVAAGRSLSPEQVEEAAKGRVWTGVQAQQLRLVDVVGGLLSAVEEVKKLLALNEKQEIELVSVPKPKSIVDALLRGKPAENSREQDKAALQTNPLRGLAALASPSEAALRDLPGLVATLALVRGSDGAAALAAQGAIALRRATETGVQPLDSGLEGSLPLR